MSRDEFMRQLEQLLEDVAEEEKKEALSFYRSYFEDAGVENEERILKELESPEKVAATIRAGTGMDGAAGTGEYTERGFEDHRFDKKQPVDIRKIQRKGSSKISPPRMIPAPETPVILETAKNQAMEPGLQTAVTGVPLTGDVPLRRFF